MIIASHEVCQPSWFRVRDTGPLTLRQTRTGATYGCLSRVRVKVRQETGGEERRKELQLTIGLVYMRVQNTTWYRKYAWERKSFMYSMIPISALFQYISVNSSTYQRDFQGTSLQYFTLSSHISYWPFYLYPTNGSEFGELHGAWMQLQSKSGLLGRLTGLATATERVSRFSRQN